MVKNNQGELVATVFDAARRFGVTPGTVSDWIRESIIPEPPKQGSEYVFPISYLEKAEKALREYRISGQARPKTGRGLRRM